MPENSRVASSSVRLCFVIRLKSGVNFVLLVQFAIVVAGWGKKDVARSGV